MYESFRQYMHPYSHDDCRQLLNGVSMIAVIERRPSSSLRSARLSAFLCVFREAAVNSRISGRPPNSRPQ